MSVVVKVRDRERVVYQVYAVEQDSANSWRVKLGALESPRWLIASDLEFVVDAREALGWVVGQEVVMEMRRLEV